MSKINHAIHEIHQMDQLASRDQWMNDVHPLVKLSITIFYIFIVVSFSKYDIIGLSAMVIYLILGFQLAELSFRESLWRLRVVLPLICLVGIANPFFDKVPIDLGFIVVTTGTISMITLMLKGIFAVLASYLLISTTTIEKICYALRIIHIPTILVTQILLTSRYITLLLDEVNKITQAYALRAPRQKGIHFKAWGSLTGQLLLRSIERANNVYESMTLRGYTGDFHYIKENMQIRASDVIYFFVWLLILIVLRKIPIFYIIGSFTGGLLR